MDLKSKNKLDTVTVCDLMGNDFYIPDYQRGYRWTEQEVHKLLLDLQDFFASDPTGDAFYCMQPLVVFYNKGEKKWEVIDGQQRLTTLYLILNQQKQRDLLEKNCPGMHLFKLSYQSRPGSEKYLANIDESKKDDNIDYFYMYEASKVIKEFLDELDKETSSGGRSFVNKIMNNNPSVKFIWYDVTDEIESKNISSEEKFSELNIGKIGLTNAELIKALFLNCVGNDESEALRIASEWDYIEHSLQDNAFWSFIYGKDDKKYATRIEFLFDIIQNKESTEDNNYYTFNKYAEAIKENGTDHEAAKKEIKKSWKEVSDKFYLYKGWYENKKLYHIIGYLRYKKHNIEDIENRFYHDPDVKDIDDFYEELKADVLRYFRDIRDIRDLNYQDSKDHKEIFDILTLFNVLSIVNCEKEDLRFSFAEFYSNSWDIEHVRSQTPKEVEGEGKKDWIICNIEYFSGVNYKDDKFKDFDSYKNAVLNTPSKDIEVAPGCTVGKICEELLDLLKTKGSITESSIYKVLFEKVFKQNSTAFKYEDSIGNLVLLDQGTNRGYKNAFFPVKRKWIYRREKEGMYILPCTKNVFSKNYSEAIFDLMNWNNEDAEAYMKEIEGLIHDGKNNI